jgi:Response regulators consisting of a CheY-like receiver domain and a winged-helix DNA-binding domain
MLKISEEKFQISYNDLALDLTPKEYELLKIFINQSHKVLSKSERYRTCLALINYLSQG